MKKNAYVGFIVTKTIFGETDAGASLSERLEMSFDDCALNSLSGGGWQCSPNKTSLALSPLYLEQTIMRKCRLNKTKQTYVI